MKVALGNANHVKTMLGVKKKTEFSLEEFYIKIEFSSQRREMFLFLTTNMVAVTSPAIAH